MKLLCKKQVGDHLYKRVKKGNMVQESRKLNCKAQVHLRECIKFPSFKVNVEWTSEALTSHSFLLIQIDINLSHMLPTLHCNSLFDPGVT